MCVHKLLGQHTMPTLSTTHLSFDNRATLPWIHQTRGRVSLPTTLCLQCHLTITCPSNHRHRAMMSEEDLTATEQRPGTSQRSGGRMSLTVLKPNPDTLRNMAIEGEEWGMGREARLQGLEALAGLSGVPGGSPKGAGSVGGMGGRGLGALPGAPGGTIGTGGQAQGAGQVGGGVEAAEGGGDKGSTGGANSKKDKEKEKDTNLPLKVRGGRVEGAGGTGRVE